MALRLVWARGPMLELIGRLDDDEDVCIQEIPGHSLTPMTRRNLLKISVLAMPSIR